MKNLPDKPGVYLLKDVDGLVLYVGKASSIKNRVSDHVRDETKKFYNRVTEVDYITTRSEKEALILEDNLIKKYRPRYNLRMKDDKAYPLILVTSEKYPRILIVRKRNKEGTYFGPYTDSLAVKNLVKFISRTFGLAACERSFKTRSRPCLKYHLKYCSAPCSGKITTEEYLENTANAIRFLSGEVDFVLSHYLAQMNLEAEKMNYEKASIYRDKIKSINHLLEKQKVFLPNDKISKDFVCFISDKNEVHIERFKLREGRLIGEDHSVLENIQEFSAEEVISYFIEREYQNKSNLPELIVVSFYIDNKEYRWFKKKIGLSHKYNLKKPSSEDEKSLMQLAAQNCLNRLKHIQDQGDKSIDKYNKEILELKEVLRLPFLPKRIEGYDISHLQGKDAYGSMVVFNVGVPDKKEYRVFKLDKSHQDDYAYLTEVLDRRLRNYVDKKDNFTFLPDLILIDGGKGHLMTALRVLKGYSIKIPVVSIAKEEETLYSDSLKYSLHLASSSPALQLLQRVRDEAHRFSQRFHHKKQLKITSVLQSVKGVGKIRAKMILNQLKNTNNIYNLSYEEFLKIEGIPQKILRRIYEQLHK